MGERIANSTERIMSRAPHVLMLFLDGVGIGRKEGRYNPFFTADLPILKNLLGGSIPSVRDAHKNTAIMSLTPIDATLDVEGLPQSGTGQAALLTGLNAPRIVGKHYGPHLYSSLKPLVTEKNIFRRLMLSGRKVFYANAFPRQYFEYINSTRYRTTAITHAWLTSGNKLNDIESLKRGHSLSSDITNERWHKLGYPHLSTITPQEAGRRLVELTKAYDFVLYEYYFTDHAGHSQSMNEAVEVLEKLDGLIGGILNNLDHQSMLFVLTSDHGNLEDLSTKSHTRNPVPFLAAGMRHREIAGQIKNLTHITPAILNLIL